MENPEVAKHKDRNAALSEATVAGKKPILPFEVEILARKVRGLQEDQAELSRLRGEAMQQSAETWHDNAPAEAISSAASALVAQAMNVLSSKESAQLFDYPDRGQSRATLGSVIKLTYNGDNTVETIILTGVVRQLDEEHSLLLPDDIQCVTLQSPLGSSLLGSQEGDTVAYSVDERKIEVTVLGVAQFQPLA